MALKAWPPAVQAVNRYVQVIECRDDLLIVVVNEAGREVSGGTILKITSEGRLVRWGGCEAPGIDTDDQGRIVLDELGDS